MQIIKLISIAVFLCINIICAGPLKMETIEVDTPFDMPAITVPDFAACPSFPIKDLGAKPDDMASTTKAIAVKSGRNQDAWRLNTPSKNIVIRNCHVRNGHQLLAIGSELSGGIENVLVENCTLDKRIAGVRHLIFIKTNIRRGGYVKNIYMRNVTAGNISKGVLGIATDVLYQWKNLVPTYEERLTPISDIFIEGISAGNMKYIARLKAGKEMPARNITMKNIKVGKVRDDPWQISNVKNLKREEVEFTREEKPKPDKS